MSLLLGVTLCFTAHLWAGPLQNAGSVLATANRILSDHASSDNEKAYARLTKGGLFAENGMQIYARKYLQQAEVAFEAAGDRYGLAKSSYYFGLGAESVAENALRLKQALSLAPDSAFLLKIDILNALANSYEEQKEYSTSEDFLERGLSIALLTKDSLTILRQYLQLLNHYLEAGKESKAKACINYVEEHFYNVENKELSGRLAYLKVVFLYRHGSKDSALTLGRAILSTSTLQDRRSICLLLSRISLEKGDYKEAITYREQADSLYHSSQSNEQNVLGLLETEYEGRLKEEKISFLNQRMRRSFYIRILLITLSVIVLLFGISIYHLQKRRIGRIRKMRINEHKRAEVEQRLLESKLRREVLMKKDLDEEILHTKEELSGFSEDFTQYSEYIDTLRQKLRKLRRNTSDDEQKGQWNRLSVTLRQTLNSNPSRRAFIGNALKVDDEFLYKLQSRFPHLTEQDIHLLVFIVLGTNSDELSSIYNIEKSSLMTKRYRLRKKLKMRKDETFEEFISTISEL